MVQLDMNQIHRRWPSPVDFYRERDNRTELEVGSLSEYANRPIEILIDPGASDSLTVQRVALVTCNLTARWARRVLVRLPHIELHPLLRRDGHRLLADRITSEMKMADPFGHFIIHPFTSPLDVSKESAALRLFVGPWQSGGNLCDDDYLIHARSWSAIGKRGHVLASCDKTEATVAAAALAASLGVADLFKRSINHLRDHWMPSLAWSTWSHSLTGPEESLSRPDELDVPEKLDFGRTLLAGTGAIGSAILYLVDMMSLSGCLHLLDRDRVELSNLNRSPMFYIQHVLARMSKTEAATRYLTKREIDLQTTNSTWREVGSDLLSQPWDVLISLTNEDSAWAELPFQMPPLVLHGTTTSGWGFGAGRHIPRVEDCTLCRMPRPAAEFRGPCAQGEIETFVPSEGARASLPFLSAASASLVLAEFLKLNCTSVTQLPNDVSADFRYGLPAVIAVKRLNDPLCRGCRAAHLSAWSFLGGRGRFNSYSEGVSQSAE